jgi:hypothetical protein
MMLRLANSCSIHRVIDKLDQFMLHEFQPNGSQHHPAQAAAFQIRRGIGHSEYQQQKVAFGTCVWAMQGPRR